MRSRWTILAILFITRATMAFQFQSVASVSSQYSQSFGASLSDIGVLIGVYFAPGAALALPGGAIGRRLGDKPTVLAGLAMMLAGELLMAISTAWSAQIAGRLLAGIGGVLINVLMTQMLTDWFTGREIATAMAIFVNSWPVGIALSLMLLPAVATTLGLIAVDLTIAALVVVSLGLIAFAYRPPEAGPVAMIGDRGRLSLAAIRAASAAGLIWCFYNVGFAMIFSFGPSMLVARGWTAAAAGSAISLVMWFAALSVPLGGLLADRSQRSGAVLVGGCVAFALLALALSRAGPVLPIVIALGLVSGLPAGPIMSLPARVLEHKTRPIGMGIFYTLYYVGMLVAPAIGGRLSTMVGAASAAIDLGALALLLCPVILWLFRMIAAGPGHRPGSSADVFTGQERTN
ncbi:MFS family permease [Variovorax paradoxus]|uniref:MFS family permease n=1 Tax=Variovorax paradoxus TaxID=34073 RepID=A0AAE3Y3T4_VARPD|nr:MFS transporter [Variovorax paradoxus]MDR6428858.1 MFS family permease [Variovorax paradoxus]MDR6455816.1 MFS family permease [Variovorax paradoxus]